MMTELAVRPLRFASWAMLLTTVWGLVMTTGSEGCACGSKAGVPASDVPAELAVNGNVVGRVNARGWQVYTCKEDRGALMWALKEPDATFDGDFKGTHFKGPTWQAADGSAVVGTKLAAYASPGDGVPWLLLGATDHTGAGKLSDVTYIQRLHTVGGKEPTIGSAKVGDETRVAYTADYVFYGPGATITAPRK